MYTQYSRIGTQIKLHINTHTQFTVNERYKHIKLTMVSTKHTENIE